MDLKVEKIKVGNLKTNCYFLLSEGILSIIDPGGDFEKIVGVIEKLGKPKPAFIFLTHAHYDHLLAVAKLKSKYKFKIAIGAGELENYENVPIQALYTGFQIPRQPRPDLSLLDGEVIKFGGCEIKVLFTPGHSAGSVCYQTGKYLFSGDTLFYHVYGRTDLITGSRDRMNSSLKKLFKIKEDLSVMPGHGKQTKLSIERAYFKKHSREMGLTL